MITVFPVTLEIAAPYMSKASEPGSFGLDTTLMRDSKDRLILPGSHVVGKLVQAVKDLAGLLGGTAEGDGYQRDLKELFADGVQDINAEHVSGREDRRNIFASDFVLETAEASAATRTRIARENATLTVAEGMLQVLEQPFHTGAALRFVGELRFARKPDEKRVHRITKALNYVSQFGGLRTIGFGVNQGALLSEPAKSRSSFAAKGPEKTLQLVLNFNDLFCTGEARNDPNTYTSATYVPGGAIKGALARQILSAHGLTGYLDDNRDRLPNNDLQALADSFGRITVRHALPTLKGSSPMRREVVLPASLAVVAVNGSDKLVDLAGLPDPDVPVVINNDAPIAQFDWKDEHWEAAEKLFGRERPPGRQLRIRTQIDEHRRAAATNRLFGIEYTRNDEHDFVAQIELPDGADWAALTNGLRTVLENGLAGIGRGGAHADISLTSTASPRQVPPSDRVVMVLQTSALLRSPDTTGLSLRDDYENALREIGLPDGWVVKAVFAEEQLAGGGFIRNRLKSPSNYAPWLLTKPGAVFVLKRENGSERLPEAWNSGGLDVPASVLRFHGLEGEEKLYRFCPYLPENGYGEIIFGVMLPDGRPSHEALAPQALGLKIEEVDVLGDGR